MQNDIRSDCAGGGAIPAPSCGGGNTGQAVPSATVAANTLPDCSVYGAIDACRLDANGRLRADFPSPLSALAFLLVIAQATERERGVGWTKWDPARYDGRRITLRPGWRIGFDTSQEVPVEGRTLTWVTLPLTDCDFVHRLLNRFSFNEYYGEDHRDGPEDTMCSFGEVCAAMAHLDEKVAYFRAAGHLREAHGVSSEPITEERLTIAARMRKGLERMYPPHELAPPSEFEKGLLLGKLRALEWVMWSGGRGSIDV